MSASVIEQYNLVPVMPCGWEGNRRSGITLAMHHRLQWFIHLWAHGLDMEMSTPPTLLVGYGTLYCSCKGCGMICVKVLFAIGRDPCTSDLHLDRIGVRVNTK